MRLRHCIAYKTLLWTGLRPSLASGNALLKIVDIAYDIKDVFSSSLRSIATTRGSSGTWTSAIEVSFSPDLSRNCDWRRIWLFLNVDMDAWFSLKPMQKADIHEKSTRKTEVMRRPIFYVCGWVLTNLSQLSTKLVQHFCTTASLFYYC